MIVEGVKDVTGSREHMRTLRVPVAFTTDLDGRISSWSDGVRIALGYEAGAWLGRPFSILFTDDDVASGVPQRVLDAARDHGSASLAGWRLDGDGQRVFALGEVAVQVGVDLEPMGYSVVVMPTVTAPDSGAERAGTRRRLVRDLPDPAGLTDLFSRSDERFYVLDDQLNFVYVNEQAATVWGVDREGLIGANLIATFPQVLDTEFLAAHLKAATDNVTVRIETFSPISGRQSELSVFPNRTEGVSVLVRDPYDRAVEASERLSDERLAEAYALLEIVRIEWRPEGDVWHVSATAAAMFGLAEGDSLESRQRHLDLLHPADRSAYLDVVDAAVTAGDGWRFEYRVLRADGELAWLEEVAVPGSDADGSYTLTLWDVTARKLAEERSRSSQRRLQRELAANRRLEEVLAKAGGAEEPQAALELVLEAACDMFAADRGTIRLLVAHEAKLRIVAQHGHAPTYLDTNAALSVDAVEFDAMFVRDEAGRVALLPTAEAPFGHDRMSWRGYQERWVPLTGLNDRVVGLMALEWRRPYTFGDRDDLDLTMLARLAAVRAEHHLLEERSRDTMQQIEQRARAQGIELVQSEIRFRQVFEVGPVASVITSVPDDRFVEVNPGYVKLTGYAADEVVGRTSRELGMWSSRDDQAKLEDAFAAGGGFRELELRLRTKDGRVREILLSGEKIMYQGQECWLKMFNDVTEQHRSQEELMAAIRQVMTDGEWFSQSVVQRLAEIRHGVVDVAEFDLSARETQVLELVAAGVDDDVIAESLGISRKTVRNHLTNIYAKTGAHSRSEAIIWARDRGIVSRQPADR